MENDDHKIQTYDINQLKNKFNMLKKNPQKNVEFILDDGLNPEANGLYVLSPTYKKIAITETEEKPFSPQYVIYWSEFDKKWKLIKEGTHGIFDSTEIVTFSTKEKSKKSMIQDFMTHEQLKSNLKNVLMQNEQLKKENEILKKENKLITEQDKLLQKRCRDIKEKNSKLEVLVSEQSMKNESVEKQIAQCKTELVELKKQEIKFIDQNKKYNKLQSENEIMSYRLSDHVDNTKKIEKSKQEIKELQKTIKLNHQEMEAKDRSLKSSLELLKKSDVIVLRQKNTIDKMGIAGQKIFKQLKDVENLCDAQDEQIQNLVEDVNEKTNQIILLEGHIEQTGQHVFHKTSKETKYNEKLEKIKKMKNDIIQYKLDEGAETQKSYFAKKINSRQEEQTAREEENEEYQKIHYEKSESLANKGFKPQKQYRNKTRKKIKHDCNKSDWADEDSDY